MSNPPELVDHILGFLHGEEDYSTLETCSAVFPELVERHLYSHITFTRPLCPPITHDKYNVDPTKFSLTLIDCPHIANYVRSVRIYIRKARARELVVISSILPKLSQISSITLDTSVRPYRWPYLDSRFRAAFQDCLRLPSIQQLAISRVTNFPINILDHCENLTHLRLTSHCIVDESISTSFSYPRLCSLVVVGQTDVTISRIVLWIESNTLHSLSLLMDFSTADVTQFRTLIEACSQTLVNLEFGSLSGEF
jgi:hypothetical protein